MENVINQNTYPTPEEQAEILLQNYVNSSNVYINGRERRKMKRELLRNAKKGKYKRVFGITSMTLDESKQHFSDLNS
jgi:hypothetical protein